MRILNFVADVGDRTEASDLLSVFCTAAEPMWLDSQFRLVRYGEYTKRYTYTILCMI